MQQLRTAKLGYVELNVTDLERSRAFYRDIVGLEFVEDGPDGEVRFRCSDDHYNVVLRQGAAGGHKRTGWMVEDENQFSHLHSALDKAGIAWEPVPEGECARRLIARATRVVIPHIDATWEYYLPTPALAHGSFTPTLAKIPRLGHVVFTTPEWEETVQFLLDVLNFRLSDDVGEMVMLMRPWPSPWHHGLGLGRAEDRHFHHLNFMVSEIDDIGKAIHRLNRNNVPIVYGPGRHPASGSAFLYFLDPDGVTLEYSFGMEQFPEVDPRAHRKLPRAPESADYWGSPVDPRMAAYGVVEQYEIASR